MHKWSEGKASGARIFMSGNKKRKLLSPSKRKTKPQVYKRRQCTFPGCFKEPLRLQNHLRQTHKITEKAELDQLMRQSSTDRGKLFRKQFESSSGSETEDEESLIKRVGSEEFGKDNNMFEEDSDGKLDWLAENYTSLLTQDPYQKQRSSDNDLDANS